MKDKELQLVSETGTATFEKYEMIERTTIDGTPFTIVTTDKGSFVGMGRFRLTEFLDYEQCESLIFTKDWQFLLAVISVLIEELPKNK